MNLLGRLPQVGDQVERDGTTFTVEQVTGRAVGSVRIRVKPVEQADHDEQGTPADQAAS